MKTHALSRLLSFASAAVAVVLALVPAVGSAQITGLAPVKHPGTGFTFGLSGTFKSTDGVSGTYKETEIVYDARSTSTTLTFTRSTDQATRTETTEDVTNADGTLTENFTSTDYGAASSFTSSRTITRQGRGQSTGQGTYLAADGTGGTLTTLETASSLGVDVLTTIYGSPTHGMSSEQRT